MSPSLHFFVTVSWRFGFTLICFRGILASARAFTAGSADQVNFSQMANILERRVLAKRSQVKLLPDAVELADASAYTIFPELKEALGLIQKEVTERLLGMMREALE